MVWRNIHTVARGRCDYFQAGPHKKSYFIETEFLNFGPISVWPINSYIGTENEDGQTEKVAVLPRIRFTSVLLTMMSFSVTVPSLIFAAILFVLFSYTLELYNVILLMEGVTLLFFTHNFLRVYNDKASEEDRRWLLQYLQNEVEEKTTEVYHLPPLYSEKNTYLPSDINVYLPLHVSTLEKDLDTMSRDQPRVHLVGHTQSFEDPYGGSCEKMQETVISVS